jgi:hypothetical protein
VFFETTQGCPNIDYPTIFSTALSHKISSKCLKYKTLSYTAATSPQEVPL